jgi:hypothetical protein
MPGARDEADLHQEHVQPLHLVQRPRDLRVQRVALRPPAFVHATAHPPQPPEPRAGLFAQPLTLIGIEVRLVHAAQCTRPRVA